MLRHDIINDLIIKNNYKRYLEIGVEDGDSINSIVCNIKHGVDPASKNATFQIPSDDFFELVSPSIMYDIIFIDGLHVADQVDRDIVNSLKHLNKNGIIVVHDCNPPTEWHQRSFEEAQKNGCRQWNGTVWQSIVKLRSERSDLDVSVVNTDWGCGLIQPKQSSVPMIVPPNPLTYTWLEQNRKEALNLITINEFRSRYL